MGEVRTDSRSGHGATRATVIASCFGAIYLLICAAYILISSRMAQRVSSSLEELHYIETLKGLLFVAITSLAMGLTMFLILRRYFIEHDQLQEKTELLENANKVKSQFLASVSHEVRTPLNGILGMMDLLKETSLTAEQREYIGMLSLSTDLLLKLMNDLLDYSKLQTGLVTFKDESHRISRFVSDHLNLFPVGARVKGIALDVSMDEKLPVFLRGPYYALRQVLINLTDNALKFTTAGKVEVRIDGEETEAGAWNLTVEVIDTGKGIAAENIERIFHEFVQVETPLPGENLGIGLGLAIVKRVVELAGGRIGVKSDPGQGTTFTVTLPFQVSSEEDIEAVQERAAADIELQSALRTILIIEDNAISAFYLRQLLTKRGFVVHVAGSGRDGIEVMRQNNFDCVLLDLHLPDMTGLSVAEEIRKHEQIRGMQSARIIAVTAYGAAEDEARCRSAGMNGFITKPVVEAELVKALV